MTGYQGFFYHFLDMKTGERFKSVELSTIDTTLLVAGVLMAGSYFDADHPEEAEIRTLADALYRRVEWDWAQPHPPLVNHGWNPEVGFLQLRLGRGRLRRVPDPLHPGARLSRRIPSRRRPGPR